MNPGCAPAKVNLWLHVGRRRRDGYHDLASLIVFALDAQDEVTAAPSDGLTLEVAGPEADMLTASLPAGGENLVLKAARALADAAGKRQRGARLTLYKTLPVASGVGGGSADAAAALRVLNTLWELDWPVERLARVGEAVGADVPVCVWSLPAAVEGKGERVDILSVWPELNAVLVNPRTAVVTREAFACYDAGHAGKPRNLPLPLGMADPQAAAAFIAEGANDLQPAVLALAPAIADVLAALQGAPGCMLARMSGSGATCFGLYDGPESAAQAAALLSQAHPEWWVRATRLGGCEGG